MIGIVGKLKLEYKESIDIFEDVIDPLEVSDFRLSGAPKIRFKIVEVEYIEDTVYGVIVSMTEPFWEEFIVEGGNIVEFEVQDLKIKGKMFLSFFE
jgi:hypothetical protein